MIEDYGLADYGLADWRISENYFNSSAGAKG